MIQAGEQLKGGGVTVWIEDDAVMIKYSVLYYGFLGTKRVPVSNITAVTWKDPDNWTVGFLELSILGEKPVSAHASPNVQNQNRLTFESPWLPKFTALRDWIQERIGRPSLPFASTADELGKLASLLKEGCITKEEFDAQKAKLLN